MSKYKIIDLFAGAGGLSLGFLSTKKFEITLAVEINRFMQETYIANHSNVRMESDIIDIVKNIDRMKRDFVNVDVVVGGPPCQGFSNANRQKSSLISNNNQLVKEYVKFIEAIKPKVFVFENVKAIRSVKHKFFVGKDDLALINRLNLKTIVEEVDIGINNTLTSLIVDFVNENGINNLCKFSLRNDIYIELNSIIKNEKKAKDKLVKLKKIIPNWDCFHDNYYIEEYRTQWYLIKENFDNNRPQECLKYIKNIIEAQKVLNKFNEIFKHNIKLIGFYIKNENITIKVETYNVFDFLLESFRKAGYIFDSGILKAVNFGVPQTRERLIIIGVRNDIIGNSKKKVELPLAVFTKQEEYTTIFNAISDLELMVPDKIVNEVGKIKQNTDIKCPFIYSDFVFDSEVIYNHVNTSTREVALERFKILSEGQNFHDLSKEQQSTYTDPSRTQNTIYQRLKYDTQCGTVVNVRKSMWIHPKMDRAVSIREAARLQSFPDSYIFKGTKDSQYQQVGNAVPPLLGKAIAEKVLDLLE